MLTRPVLLRILFTLSLFLGVGPAPGAQVFTDRDLFLRAQSALQRSDYVETALNLYAYVQRGPDAMKKDPAHAGQVSDVLHQVRQLLAAPAAPGGAAFTKGDNPNESIVGRVTGLSVQLALDTPKSPRVKAYPLAVQGGGNLHFNYTPFSNLSPRPQVRVTFAKAPRSAATALQPGQAAWLDRPLHGPEPTELVIGDPLLAQNAFSLSWNVRGVLGISSSLGWLSVLQDPSKTQVFQVYNNRKGQLIATKIGR